MSSYAPPPFALTDAAIAAVISAATIAGVYDPNGHLTDAGIAAAISAGTVATKVSQIPQASVGSTCIARTASPATGYGYGISIAGSSLNAIGWNWDGTNDTTEVVGGWAATALSGTWVCMGQAAATTSNYQINNWLRVA